VIAAALIVSACATSEAPRSAQVEIQGDSAFTITETVRVGGKVRSDFESAIRLLDEQQYDTGIALLRGVTEAAPHLTTAHLDLGIAYSRVEDLERAEASLDRALELTPRHPVAHNELGIVYRKTGRFQEARQSYEQALTLVPGFHFARRNLAILCDLYLADVSCALEHYELYLQAAPHDEAAAMWIADLRNRATR
jgi:Flp pilus assembly protein TadD